MDHDVYANISWHRAAFAGETVQNRSLFLSMIDTTSQVNTYLLTVLIRVVDGNDVYF